MLLSLKNLQKNYPGFSLDVSMEVEEGQITGLIGANGAGKSTTFKVILGLVHPDAGEIRLFNKDMEQISQKEKADIGATLSDSGFSNCLTVKQIVHILTETYEKFDREMFEKRCSQFSILQNLPNAYMWASPMPKRALEQYHLVLRKCPAQRQRMKDVLVYPERGTLRPEEQTFVQLLHKQAALTVK